MKKLYFLFLVFCLCLANMANGQTIQSYSFNSPTTTAFTPISDATGTVANGDDKFVNNVPLGFNFIYDGKCYNSVGISYNGYIRFGSVTAQPYDNQIRETSTPIDNIIVPFGTDLHPRNDGSSRVSYKTGTDYFVVEWLNVDRRYYINQYHANNENLSFQLRLYNDHKIEFIYGNFSNPLINYYLPQVGLKGNSTSSAISLNISNWNSPSTVDKNTTNNYATYSSSNPSVKPANGLVYRFTPPAKAIVLESTDAVNNVIDYGDVFTTATLNKTITIRNVGTQPLTIEGLSFTTAAFFTTISTPQTIAFCSSFTTVITFNPDAVTSHSSWVTVISPDSPTVFNNMMVKGNGKETPLPKIQVNTSDLVNPNAYFFNDIETNTFATAFITIRNVGLVGATLPLSINSIEISSIVGATSFFSVSPIIPLTTVLDLNSGSLSYITVVFNAGTVSGNYLSKIKINSNGGENASIIDSEVFLYGRSLVKTRTARFSPAPLDFEKVNINTEKILEVNIENTGNTDFYLQTPFVNITGANSADFEFVTITDTRVIQQDKSSVKARIKFKPTTTGAKTATLSIVTKDALTNPGLTMTLQGNATTGQLLVSTTNLAFGSIPAFNNATQNFTIRNTGNGVLNIKNLQGLSDPFTSTSSPILANPFVTTTLAAGASLSVSVNFAPTESNTYNQNVLIDTDAATGTAFATVNLTGTSKQAEISLNMPSADFGEILADGINEFVTTFAITNTGNDDLKIYPDLVNMPPYYSIISSFPNPTTITPNSSFSFDLKFKPVKGVATDYIKANMRLLTTNPSPTGFIEGFITVYGKGTTRILDTKSNNNFQTSIMNFGYVSFGDTKTLRMTVKNEGNTRFKIASIITNSAEYTVEPYNEWVEATSERVIDITFKATTNTGSKNAFLTVNIDPTTPLSTMVSQHLELTAILSTYTFEWIRDLAFGTRNIGESPVKTIRLNNTGNQNLNISGVTSNDNDFVPSNVFGTVNVGSFVDFDVTFRPSKAIDFVATITVNFNGHRIDVPNFITATGKVIPSYIIGTNPKTVDFGSYVRVNQSVLKKFKVYNTGNSPFTITGFTIDKNSDQYILESLYNGKKEVAPNSFAEIEITFKPNFESEKNQTKNAILTILTKEEMTSGDPRVILQATGRPRATRILQVLVDGKPNNTVNFGNVEVSGTVFKNSGEKVVVFKNVGNDSLIISGLNNTSYQDILSANFAKTIIKPNEEASVNLTFKPTKNITYSDMKIEVVSDQTAGNPIILCNGVGIQGKIELLDANKNAFNKKLDFGKTRIGLESQTLIFMIKNAGTAELKNVKITLTKGADVYTVVRKEGNIKVGDPVSVTVFFKPKAEGLAEGQITVTADNVENNNQTIELIGEGTQAEIQVERKLSFGNVRRVESLKKYLRITNNGKETLYISNILIEKTKPNTVSENFTLSSKKMTIEAGGYADLEITFTPSAISDYEANLTIETLQSTKGEKTVALTGKGIQAIIKTDVKVKDFGLCNNNASILASINIKNEGEAPLNVQSIKSKNNLFEVINPESFSLNKSETKGKTINLRFSPKLSTIIGDTKIEDELIIMLNNSQSTEGQDQENGNTKTIKLIGTAIIPLEFGVNFKVNHQETIVYNQSIAPSIEFSKGVKPKEITCEYQRISNMDNAMITANVSPNKDSLLYTSSIPAIEKNDIGMVYKFKVIDRMGKEVNIDKFYSYIVGSNLTLNLKKGEELKDYQIVSVPYWLQDPNVVKQFEKLGKYNIKKWRLFKYNGTKYIELDNNTFKDFELGIGYMFIGRDVPLEGIELSAYQAYDPTKKQAKITEDKPFGIMLKRGWNLIASPYDFDITFSEIRKNRASISSTMYNKHNGTEWVKDSILTAKKGAFVFCTDETFVIFPVFKNQKIQGQGGRLEQTEQIFSEKQFDLNFRISDGKQNYFLGGIGMNPNAKNTYDQYDDPALPLLYENELRLNFVQTNEINLTKSVVPTAENYIWEMEIKGEEEFLEIHWDKNYFNTDKQIILYEMATQTPIDMKNLDKYRFKRQETNKFKIYYGNYEFFKEQMKASKVIIGEIYPNPYESDVYIPFSMPFSTEAYQVELNVYDLGGRKIDQQKKSYSYGFHTWKYSNLPANKGNYLIKMVISDSKTVYERVFKTISQ